MELMLLVIQGYTSSYALWTYVKNNKTEYVKPVAYKNINQRFLRLAKLNFLKEVQLGKNPHRRIDYKLTIKGLEELIPYLIVHPEKGVQDIIQYMDKFGLDKHAFGDLLVRKTIPILSFTDQYWESGLGKKIIIKPMRLSPQQKWVVKTPEITIELPEHIPRNINQVIQLQKSIAEYHRKLLDVKDELIIQQAQSQRQIVESKSKMGHRIRTTSMMIPDNPRSEFDEQMQRQLEEGKPEIDDGELAEDLDRQFRPKAELTPTAAGQKKTIASQKKKN